MKRTIGFVCAMLISGALGGLAHADVLPPDVSACSGKKPGDSCEAGRCQETTCQRLDYTQRDCGVPLIADAGTAEGGLPSSADAGSGGANVSCPPGSITYPCLKCMAGGEGGDAGVQDDAGMSPGKDDKDGGGCAVSARSVGAQLAALLFAGTFAALVSRRRRR